MQIVKQNFRKRNCDETQSCQTGHQPRRWTKYNSKGHALNLANYKVKEKDPLREKGAGLCLLQETYVKRFAACSWYSFSPILEPPVLN